MATGMVASSLEMKALRRMVLAPLEMDVKYNKTYEVEKRVGN